MTLTRRAFTRGAGAAAAGPALLWFRPAFAGPASGEPEPIVLARSASVVLTARETHVVLTPVPPRRQQKARPKTKGAKTGPRRMQLVIRDLVIRDGASAYDVLLVLEGPNVFEASTTRVDLGPLEPGIASDDAGGGRKGVDKKGVTIALEANDAFARFAKIRGFNMRHLRVVIVRRGAKDEHGKESVPPDPTPPEIGAIELVQL